MDFPGTFQGAPIWYIQYSCNFFGWPLVHSNAHDQSDYYFLYLGGLCAVVSSNLGGLLHPDILMICAHLCADGGLWAQHPSIPKKGF